MLKRLKEKLWKKSRPTLIVDLLTPEHYKDGDDDCYYWAAAPNKDFLEDIAKDFPESEQLYCEFDVPLRGTLDDIRLLVTDKACFPMNAPILTEDLKHYHFATARGMELRWKLRIPDSYHTSRVLLLEKAEKGSYKIIKVYRNHHEDKG